MQRREISKTPRNDAHSRKVHFAIAMREKISKNWVALREELKKGPHKKRKKKT